MNARRRLSRLWVRGPAGERGAVAVAVALLFPLLFAAAALAVDTAGVWSSRSQIIAGADAATLAAALDCANNRCLATQDLSDDASHYYLTNNANAKLAGDLQPSYGWITTDTSKRGAHTWGSWPIHHFFAAALGFPTGEISVSSVARWAGAVAATTEVPLAVSWCTYQSATSQGLDRSGSTVQLSLSTKTSGSCTPPSGGTVAGGTALVTAATGSCATSTKISGTPGRPANAPAACTTSYLSGLAGRTLWIPVFDQFSPGANGTARIYAYAALKVTSVATASPATLTGYFVTQARQTDRPSTTSAPDLGARAVYLDDPDSWG